MNRILFVLIAFLPFLINAQLHFMNGEMKISQKIVNIDTTKKVNKISITVKNSGLNIDSIRVIATNEGTLNDSLYKFIKIESKINPGLSVISTLELTNTKYYKSLEGKTVILKIASGTANPYSYLFVNFQMHKVIEEPNLDFFRLNVGANFDFIQTNPARLLYLDANLMSQKAFKLKIIDKYRDFGVYGRIFQFQGITQIDNIRPLNFRDTLGVNGQPTIIKKISDDKYKIAQPIMSRSFSDVIKQRNYGLAFGISKTLIDDRENKFNLSLGLHFEGLLTFFESEIKYSKIISDTIEVTKNQYIKEFNNELPIVQRRTYFQNTIGFSVPISWRFSAFELRVLPAFSLFNSRANSSYGTLLEGARGYSLYANLSEIKETGLNIGCEVRGYTKMRPSTFSIFIAKVFNLNKIGEFLKLY